MQQDDLKTPATKGDLAPLALKTDLIDLEQRMAHRFDLAVETIRHDILLGANRDEIEVIKDRVTRLEKHTGLPVAA